MSLLKLIQQYDEDVTCRITTLEKEIAELKAECTKWMDRYLNGVRVHEAAALKLAASVASQGVHLLGKRVELFDGRRGSVIAGRNDGQISFENVVTGEKTWMPPSHIKTVEGA